MALAKGILVVSLFISDSMEHLIDVTYFMADRQDATLSFIERRPQAVVMQIARLPGILAAAVMERSKIPLTKWVLAYHLTAASKKGISAKQLQRMLGLTYKSAWFLAMRIKEAMDVGPKAGPLGGRGKAVESDETFVGGKKKNVHKGKPEPKKHAVHALVEPGGYLKATHVPDVTAKTLRSVMEKHADPRSALHTDDSLANLSLGKGFAGHKVVNHSAGEYYKDGAGIPSAESFFAILKRGVYGSFRSVSEQHLARYIAESSSGGTLARR
jgi:hypothetical protein